MQRKCRVCCQEFSIESFAGAGTINGIKYWKHKCKKCNYLDTSSRRRMIRNWYIRIKKNLSCAHCGNSDYRVLEFDHLDRTRKEFVICDGVRHGYGETRLLKEMAKCQVLCANCHRIKTHNEQQNKMS